MRVKIHLRPASSPEPATGLLLLSQEPAEVLQLCARIGSDPAPAIFPISGGFLLKLATPAGKRYPGTIGLRSLCNNLFLPADARVVPELYDEEARALVRDQGIVLLPGGRALGFAFDEPLSLAALMTGPPLTYAAWAPLPTPRHRVDHIQEISLHVPRSAEDILDLESALRSEDELDKGIEKDRLDLEDWDAELPPEESVPGPGDSPLRGLAQHLQNWGRKIRRFLSRRRPRPRADKKRKPKQSGAAAQPTAQGHGFGLLRALSKWARGFLQVPLQITRSLVDRQRAALLRLLYEFREGDLDKALRRALPAAEQGGSRGRPYRGTTLPIHNLLYMLSNLFGPRATHGWVGGADLWPDLLKEYRKAAEQALQRGDYRRAAVIYGKLIRDFKMAANALMQGGLYHDAGILYLTKVGDRLAAGGAFEAAGELDRAVALYREAGQHALAGDALRRAGEDEAALVEYRRAAEELVAKTGSYLAAGDLLATRALRPDLALDYFSEGWARRPELNDVACALRLAQHYADQHNHVDLDRLVSEADDYLSSSGNDSEATQFYNDIARLADCKGLEAIRDDLRDRALLGLAAKLRQRANNELHQGRLVSTMLGQSGAWQPALVSDAAYAVQGAAKHLAARDNRQSPYDFGNTALHLPNGLVTAACSATETGNIFLGFANGDVVYFCPARNEVMQLPGNQLPGVTSLATDATGRLLVALRCDEDRPPVLTSYVKNPEGPFVVTEQRRLSDGPGPYWLTQVYGSIGDNLVAVCDGFELKFLRGLRLHPDGNLGPSLAQENPISAVLLPPPRGPQPHPFALVFLEGRLWHVNAGEIQELSLNWKPGVPRGNQLRSANLSCVLREIDRLEVVTLDEPGIIHWLMIGVREKSFKILANHYKVVNGGYSAAALLRAGFAVGVAPTHVDWIRPRAKGLDVSARTKITLPRAVACFPSPMTGELVIICSNGVLARLPIPN